MQQSVISWLNPGGSLGRCSFCHAKFAPPQSCPDCGSQLHQECWEASGKCPSLGCGQDAESLPRTRVPPWSLITLAFAGAAVACGLNYLAGLPARRVHRNDREHAAEEAWADTLEAWRDCREAKEDNDPAAVREARRRTRDSLERAVQILEAEGIYWRFTRCVELTRALAQSRVPWHALFWDVQGLYRKGVSLHSRWTDAYRRDHPEAAFLKFEATTRLEEAQAALELFLSPYYRSQYKGEKDNCDLCRSASYIWEGIGVRLSSLGQEFLLEDRRKRIRSAMNAKRCRTVLDRLNSWCKEELDFYERPHKYPGKVARAETGAWVFWWKAELEKLGQAVEWNAKKRRYELDHKE